MDTVTQKLAQALADLHSCHRAFSSNDNWTTLDDDARANAEQALEEYEATTAAPMPYEAWPAANGDDDPAEWRIDRDRGNGTADIIAWVYTEADAKMIADALNREK